MNKSISSIALIALGAVTLLAGVLAYLFRDTVADAVPLVETWKVARLIAPILLFSGSFAVVAGVIQRQPTQRPDERVPPE